MSEILSILGDVIDDRAGLFADTIQLLRTGLKYLAEVEAVQNIELNETLGRDPRESCIFHFNDKGVFDKILLTDRIKYNGQTFVVLRRTNNPTSNQIEYGCMLLTDKDQ